MTRRPRPHDVVIPGLGLTVGEATQAIGRGVARFNLRSFERDDITQEVLKSVLELATRGEFQARSPNAFLKVAARNTLLNLIRQHEADGNRAAAFGEMIERLPPAAEGYDLVRVHEILERFEDDSSLREIVILLCLGEMTETEIVNELGRSRGKIRWLLRSIRQRLRFLQSEEV